GLKKVESYLGQHYPLIMGGEIITTEDKIDSVSPANKEELVGRVSKESRELAEKAIQVAYETFQTWRKSKPEMRADILFRSAAHFRLRKHDFS
ncbi:aldehyde dehydrogenase family protein, partial [Bacillus cereus]|uniref:aldehyde dehydrogenase family protein n=1 Tax=Bacillus cereus TaxID=1396 RepID=UPI00284A7A09